MKLLSKLYSIHSPSHGEKNMSEFVQNSLRKMDIPFETDKRGQVFKLIPGRPIVSCHMDQVQSGPPGTIRTDGDKIWGDKDGLGADDKNGIWVCLNLLLRWDCSFIFSTAEEAIAHEVEHVLRSSEEVLRRIPYCLVFDRRGAGDIIGSENGYCHKPFEDRVAALGKDFGYRPTTGVFSDADSISQYCECVNLSVGYYEAHSKTEYTKFSELRNALRFGDFLLAHL